MDVYQRGRFKEAILKESCGGVIDIPLPVSILSTINLKLGMNLLYSRERNSPAKQAGNE